MKAVVAAFLGGFLAVVAVMLARPTPAPTPPPAEVQRLVDDNGVLRETLSACAWREELRNAAAAAQVHRFGLLR